MIRRPTRSTLDRSSAASDVYKRQEPRLCASHLTRWRKSGKPAVDEFLQSDQVHPLPDASDQRERYSFSLDGTHGRLRAELQFGLQQRNDRRTTRLFPSDFRSAVDAARNAGIETLIGTEPLWSDGATRGGAAFLRFTEREVVRLLEPSDLLERDVWRSDSFPNSGANRVLSLRFNVIDQPWLRTAHKSGREAPPPIHIRRRRAGANG